MKNETFAPYIEYMLEAEAKYPGFHFEHTGAYGDGTLTVSYSGYKHMDLVAEIVPALFKLGCRYDFDRSELEHFDEMCGRTFVYLKIPKVKAKSKKKKA